MTRSPCSPGVALVILALAAPCCGESRDALGCAVRLELPYYQPLARNALLQGHAEARFTVGTDGAPETISVKASHELLRRIVESRLSNSRFKQVCVGEKLTLRVEFALRQPRTKYGPTEIVLIAPDTIEVITTLPEATIEGTPIPDPENSIVIR